MTIRTALNFLYSQSSIKLERSIAAAQEPEQATTSGVCEAPSKPDAAAPVPEYDPCEGDETYHPAAAPELKAGDLVMCWFACYDSFQPMLFCGYQSKAGNIRAKAPNGAIGMMVFGNWRLPTPAELAEHSK